MHYHLNGGTIYPQLISALALVIALDTKKIEPFWDREIDVRTLDKQFPSLSEEKIYDVGKLLNVIYKDMHLRLNINDEVKQYVQEKKNIRKVGGNHESES